MPILEIKELMVFYENALAVNNFSMRVDEGEIVGVLGPNGAGKSTLMYAISGLLLDRQIKEERRGGERITILGEIAFNGEEITREKASDRVKRGIVLCMERHPVFPESSVLENLRTGGYLRRRPEVRERLDYVFELFPALVRLKRQAAGFLSGGEQQMLAIGTALVARPSLLLLDEPLLGLSPAIQAKLVEAIQRIRDETGIAILIAEQYARPVLPIIDRGYVLENGTVTFSGTGEELMENPDMRAAYFGV
ncbi:MAG: ABC transporter ATP-binding protein [Candidatus Bipolaricaulia bacterium]